MSRLHPRTYLWTLILESDSDFPGFYTTFNRYHDLRLPIAILEIRSFLERVDIITTHHSPRLFVKKSYEELWPSALSAVNLRAQPALGWVFHHSASYPDHTIIQLRNGAVRQNLFPRVSRFSPWGVSRPLLSTSCRRLSFKRRIYQYSTEAASQDVHTRFPVDMGIRRDCCRSVSCHTCSAGVSSVRVVKFEEERRIDVGQLRFRKFRDPTKPHR